MTIIWMLGVYKTNNKCYKISTLYKCIELNSIIIGNDI